MRIMIVDDEVIIRTGLAKVIKWDELGLELLAPAASAEEALQRIPEERPNILLTDIRMTGKNGLQLAEEAKRILPDLEVIILSGYDDFAYTQQAIRQGVSDYLLKTSRPEEIVKTVLRAKQRIEERWAAYNQDLVKNKEARDRLFERWVVDGETAGIDPKLLAATLPRLFGENGDQGGRLQILLVAAEGWYDSPAFESLLLFAVDNILNDLLKCETLIRKNRVVAAVRVGETVRAGERKELDLQYRRYLIQKIEQLLKCNVFVAGGKLVDKPEQLHESYETAAYTFGYKEWIDAKLLDYEDIRRRKGGRTVCTREEELELSAILLEDDPVALRGWVQRFFQDQLENPEMTLESLEACVHSAAIAAHRWLARVMAAIGHEDALKEGAPPFDLKLGKTLKEALFQHLYTVMKLYHDRLAEGQATHVKKAIAYIEEHLGGDVGLQQVAKHVHLHPNHMSEVFKKETGMTFGDFVTRQRMRRAMEILSVSPSKISEVAAQVGYDDVKYFSQLFKKFTGRTPSEFREHKAARRE